jgi:hypothetical protein
MRGLDPRIHLLCKNSCEEMDCRVKPGNDRKVAQPQIITLFPYRLRAITTFMISLVPA